MKTTDTNQYELDLRDYYVILVKRRRLIIFTALFVGLLSFVSAFLKQSSYESAAAVKVEQSKTMSGLFLEVFSWNAWDNIASESEVIRSTPVLAKAAQTLGLVPPELSFDDIRESETYSAVVQDIQGKIRTEQEGSTNIINIFVTSSDPQESKGIANAVAAEYRSYHVFSRTNEARRTREFIEQQLIDTQEKLEVSEGRLRAFKEAKNFITLDAEMSLTLNRLQGLQTEYEKVKRRSRETAMMIDRLRQNTIAGLDQALAARPYIESDKTILYELNSRLVELILSRKNLLIDYTAEHPQVKAIDEKIVDVKGEMLKELQSENAVYQERESGLDAQISEILDRNENLPEYELQLTQLQRDVRVNEELYSLLRTKHQEAQIREKEHADEVTIIRTALEGVKINDKLKGTTVVGLVLGLMMGLVAALVRETLDTSIGTIEDVERYLEIPVLGVIPHINLNEIKEFLLKKSSDGIERMEDLLGRHAHLITHLKPKSSVAESYRTLRTNIQFTNLEKRGQVILFTSSSLKEGKSTTVANLSITKAQEGSKVLLVNCDLRKPSIYQIMGLEKEVGLTDVILGKLHWKDVVKDITDLMMGKMRMDDIMRTPGLENLHIITCGGVPPNPSELLSSKGMSDFLDEVREEYDIVLVDCPPILPVTDAAILAPKVDGVVLVYQAGRIPRNALKRAKTHLENVRANILGIVLNDITAEISGYYPLSQYQSKYYGEDTVGDEKEKDWSSALAESLERAKMKFKKIHS